MHGPQRSEGVAQVTRLDAFLMLHGRRALAWVGGFRRRHTRIVAVRVRERIDGPGRIAAVRFDEGKGWVRV